MKRTPWGFWIGIVPEVYSSPFNHVSDHVYLDLLTEVWENTLHTFRACSSDSEVHHGGEKNLFHHSPWTPLRKKKWLFFNCMKSQSGAKHFHLKILRETSSLISFTYSSNQCVFLEYLYLVPISIDTWRGVEDTIVNKTVSALMKPTAHWVHSIHSLY